MASHKYMRSPPNLPGMPPGVPYIIGNEAAERFSYYGMKSVLTVFMAHYILNQSGVLAPMQENEVVHVHASISCSASISFQFSARFSPTVGSASIGRFFLFDRLLPRQSDACMHGHRHGVSPSVNA